MDLLTYLIKVDLLLVLGMLAYIPLRPTTFFKLRRAWILGALAVSFTWPLMQFIPAGPLLIGYRLPAYQVTNGPVPDRSFWDMVPLLAEVHMLMTGLLLMRLTVRLVFALRRPASAGAGPFSFFRRIVLPPGHDPAARAAFLAHERTHVRQGHSFDVVLADVLHAIDWSFPLWAPLRRELRLVHEHLADDAAHAAHTDYDGLLLAEALHVPAHVLVNGFHASDLKTRIQMLNTPRSPRKALRRLALAAPALLLGTLLISWQAVPLRIDPQKPQNKAEQMPEYPGGTTAMVSYLGNAVHYPKAAAEAGVEGTVVVRFVVDTDGRLQDVAVEKGVNEALDTEALRVVRTMPDWTPGRDKGKPVAVQMMLPVKFVLAAEK